MSPAIKAPLHTPSVVLHLPVFILITLPGDPAVVLLQLRTHDAARLNESAEIIRYTSSCFGIQQQDHAERHVKIR
ncbi:hypothetical protein F4780DRAFT_776635 [Xylariomycetidae sp. FL0641]|nr:hypothetical protein F4780DRAFT_776635 [Xylariomycetidae sp. FL0641]